MINVMIRLRGKLDPCLKILWGFVMSTGAMTPGR